MNNAIKFLVVLSSIVVIASFALQLYEYIKDKKSNSENILTPV